VQFDVVTIFPEMLAGPFEAGVIGRAHQAGRFALEVHDLRAHAEPPHHKVDDEPYGGGAGMVFSPEPLLRAVESLRQPDEATAVVMPSPDGQVLDQALVRELLDYDRCVILCGRYEGCDERVRAAVTHEIGLGDFVLTGGEPVAIVLVDAIARLIDGVVGRRESVTNDSFQETLLDHPAYTRPATGPTVTSVPQLLLSGHHQRVTEWRRRQRVRRTLERRPDLVPRAMLDPQNEELVTRERRHRRR